MINMQIGIGFTVQNLTEFVWHELQDVAQKVINEKPMVFHNIPDCFRLEERVSVTHKDQDLWLYFRRDGNCIDILFVQKTLHGLGEGQ